MKRAVKTLAVFAFSALAVQCAYGRSISLDLSGGRPAAAKSIRGASLPVGTPIRSSILKAGSADVGDVAVGDILSVRLFDDLDVSLTLARKMPRSSAGCDAFIAELSGGGLKNAVVLRTGSGLTMDVQDSRRKRVYKVLSTPTEVKVQELVAESVNASRCRAIAPPAPAAGVRTSVGASSAPAGGLVQPDADSTVVDVLVVYELGAAEWVSLNGGMAAFAELSVQKMNEALVNSGLGDRFRFNCVGSWCVPARSDDLEFVLIAATDGKGEGWESIGAMRDKVGADIVTVLVDTGMDDGFVGLGWALKAESDKDPDKLDIGLYDMYGYNVCSVRSVAVSHTMTHETGHNMGAGHSELQAVEPGPQLYSYSSACYFSVDEVGYHTIMAYDDDGPGGYEVPYFSTPECLYEGVPVGDEAHDNAATLARTFDAVSKWRTPTGSEIDDWDPNASILIKTDERYEAEPDGSFTLCLSGRILSLSGLKVAVKGLPAGLRYDASTMTFPGRATKPGKYSVTISATNATVKKPSVKTFELVVPNLKSEVLPNLAQDTNAYGIVSCGVALNPDRINCAPTEDGWTVKVAGLPAGLKYDAKTGKITGVPTKAGTFTVTFTATKKGVKEKEVATITLKTEALPTWATGTFAGYAAVEGKRKREEGKSEELGRGSEEFGYVTMTVAANGKVSGKIALGGTNWTFSAASFSRAEESSSSEVGSPKSFVVEALAKAGKATMPVVLEVAACDDGGTGGALGDRALPNAVVEGAFGGGEVKMWRNIWKDKATATEAKKTIAQFEGVYAVSMEDYGGYLSLTVGKNGDVKASGKLADGTSVSATSPLMCDGDEGWFAMLYAAPSAYKGGSFAAAVGFETDGGGAVVTSNSRLAPVLFAPQWINKNSQATGEYGEGFVRELDFTGAYYDKTKKLNDYYDALQFSAEPPTLNGVEPQNDGEVEITIDAKGKPVIDKASGLTLSFAQATGIFRGGYTFVFDAKTKKKVSFEGILVPGSESLRSFYLWGASSSYNDPKTGKPKTYKYKDSHWVRCERRLQ